jgi:hypothetical protein
MLQGNVDISFRVKGSRGERVDASFSLPVLTLLAGAGTLYFTSVRKAKGEPFTIRLSLCSFRSRQCLSAIDYSSAVQDHHR